MLYVDEKISGQGVLVMVAGVLDVSGVVRPKKKKESRLRKCMF